MFTPHRRVLSGDRLSYLASVESPRSLHDPNLFTAAAWRGAVIIGKLRYNFKTGIRYQIADLRLVTPAQRPRRFLGVDNVTITVDLLHLDCFMQNFTRCVGLAVAEHSLHTMPGKLRLRTVWTITGNRAYQQLRIEQGQTARFW